MKVYFGDRFVNGVKPLFDKKSRKWLGDKELLADLDVLAIAGLYLKKAGVTFEINGREQRACENVWNNYRAAVKEGRVAAQKFNSMQGYKELLYAQALLLNVVNERILQLEFDLVAANTRKTREEKKAIKNAQKQIEAEHGKMVDSNSKAVYKRNRDEAVAVWGILGARVVRNFYNYKMAVNNNNGEPNKEIIVNGKNVTNIMQKLYHGKFTKIYPISEYKDRDRKFDEELPKFVSENRRELMTTLHGMYDQMTREIMFGKVEPYTFDEKERNFFGFDGVDEQPSRKGEAGKRTVAGLLAFAMMFNAVGRPVSQIVKGAGNKLPEDLPPIVEPTPDVVPPVQDDSNIVITDDPEVVPPNPAEDNEEVQDNIGDNGTIKPNLPQEETKDDEEAETPGENESTEQPEETDKKPEYDMPYDPIPDENKTNHDKGNDSSEDFWVMN